MALRRKPLLVLAVLILGVVVVVLPRVLAWADRKTVAALSWQLAHRLIVVDPGHGGIDPGAVGRGGVLEKDIALAVALRLAELLRQGARRSCLPGKPIAISQTPKPGISRSAKGTIWPAGWTWPTRGGRTFSSAST